MAWGGKLGLNLSGSSYSPLPANTSNDVRGGLGGGGFFRYRFSDRFSIQPELLLMMKGLELKSNSGGVRTEEEIRMNYLEIPVLFRWTPGKESSRFRLFAGPFLSFLLSAKDELEVQGGIFGPVAIKIETDVKDQTRDIDWGMAMGAGLDFASGLLLEARYSHGFTDASKSSTTIRHRVASLLIGWAFSL